MNIGLILASMGVVVAIPHFTLAIVNRNGRFWGARKRTRVAASARVPFQPGRDRIRWVDANELARLVGSDPEMVIFHLVGDDSSETVANRLPGQVAVTLQELEQTLAWIPQGSRLAVYRPDGIGWTLGQRISQILGGREAILLSPASHCAGKLKTMAGETCN